MDEARARELAQKAIALLASTYHDGPDAVQLLLAEQRKAYEAALDLLASLPSGDNAPKEPMLRMLTSVETAADDLREAVLGFIVVGNLLLQAVARRTGLSESEVLQDLAMRLAQGEVA